MTPGTPVRGTGAYADFRGTVDALEVTRDGTPGAWVAWTHQGEAAIPREARQTWGAYFPLAELDAMETDERMVA